MFLLKNGALFHFNKNLSYLLFNFSPPIYNFERWNLLCNNNLCDKTQAKDFFPNIFDTTDWPPKWFYIISDLLIWAAYFTIHVILIYFIKKKQGVPDIKALEQAGVLILTEEGKGYTVMEGYRIPPVMFTENQANALILAEQLVLKTIHLSKIIQKLSTKSKLY